MTSYGAQGDAVTIYVNTIKFSNVVTIKSNNSLSASDIGKTILLYGVGMPTGTGNQDIVAQIWNVFGGTNITISTYAGVTASGIVGLYGTQNADSFQQCVDACSGTNSIIHIPAGRYLLIPPAMLNSQLTMPNPSYVWPAVTIRRGGIQFLGAGPNSSVLIGCGAWLKKGSYAHRGYMFFCQGPIVNNYPLIFDGLNFDGGIERGAIANKDFPANPNDGTGWDETHGAVLDIGPPPLHFYKAFRNCKLTHWRGEMLKSVAPDTDGFIDVTNCYFYDGNASAFNFSFSHHIDGCIFSNVKMATEFYAGYSTKPSIFENSIITNAQAGLVLSGALTNHSMPAYTIRGNKISASQFNILMGPSRNITIRGNALYNAVSGIQTSSYAYQGNDCNGNILVEGNTFNNIFQPFVNGGCASNRMENVIVRSNLAFNCQSFASGTGWGTNVTFIGNSSSGGMLDSSSMIGQWFIDDDSNQFPYHSITASPILNVNVLSYAQGMRHQISAKNPAAIFAIDDTHPLQIPAGARMNITNAANFFLPLYLSTTLTNSPIVIQPGASVTCRWANSAWMLQLSKVSNIHFLPTNAP